MIQPISTSGNRSVVVFLVGGTLLLLVEAFFRLAPTVAPDPLTAAWHRAQAAGSYAFRADIEQIASPAPTVANVGRSAQSDRFTLQGQTDLANQAMDLRLWGETGSLLLADTATELRLRDGALACSIGPMTMLWAPSRTAMGAPSPMWVRPPRARKSWATCSCCRCWR